MLVLASALVALVVLDAYTDWLKPVTDRLEGAALPFYWITNLPSRMAEWGDDGLNSRSALVTKNNALESELLIHKGRLLRMAELAAENVRLRNLLNATELLKDSVLVTELIGVSPDPASHTILINRGSEDDVFVGQPVLDANGLMGQVIEVHNSHSRALLITDSTHALPVQVLRNGVRSIAEGVGRFDHLRLRFVSPTMDIREGDELVSSGLGGRYPVGYPVGTVIRKTALPGHAFVEIEVKPAAWLNRSRHLLIVFSAVEKLQGR